MDLRYGYEFMLYLFPYLLSVSKDIQTPLEKLCYIMEETWIPGS